MNKNYLIFDVDNTLLEKQSIDNESYKLVSSKFLDTTIELVKHPITGEEDVNFTKKTNEEIWKYKLKQANIENVNIGSLVMSLGIELYNFLEQNPSKLDEITQYIYPSQIKEVSNLVNKIGIATSGPKLAQQHVLNSLGYFDAGIDPKLASYSENGGSKDKILMNSINKYIKLFGVPEKIIFADDSMVAINQFKKLDVKSELIGILIHPEHNKDFNADLVISSLKEDYKQFFNYVEALK